MPEKTGNVCHEGWASGGLHQGRCKCFLWRFCNRGRQFFLYGPSYKTRTSSRFVRVFCYKKVGADDGIRTHDINLGKVALYPWATSALNDWSLTASVCQGVYKVFRSWQDFFREKILFSRNTDVAAGMGTQEKKEFWSAMRVAPFLVHAVFGESGEA